MWGIIAAELYLSKKIQTLSPYLKSWWMGLLVAYFGRLLMLTEIVSFFGPYGFVVKAFAAPIMTLGFAIFLLYLLENSQSLIGRLFSTGPVLFLGRLSYSIYLWHWLVKSTLSAYLIRALVWFGNFAPIIGFFIIAVFTIALSIISYKYLEEPYFRKRTKLKVSL